MRFHSIVAPIHVRHDRGDEHPLTHRESGWCIHQLTVEGETSL
jgi:hypothetical protein